VIDKKELKRAAKERVTAKGICAVRCKTSGEVWVGSSRDIPASQTGIWFGLRNGMHFNKGMQASWSLNGAESFSFGVLETFDEDMPPMLLKDALRDRQKHWTKELDAKQI
jgi:hypothetical protein